MASKFANFIQESGIDPRRLMAASAKIECLKLAGRQALAAAKKKKGKKEGKEGEAAPAAAKPELPSTRPVTRVLFDRAIAGKAVRSKSKTRLLRAVNRVLEQKKKDAVDLRALF